MKTKNLFPNVNLETYTARILALSLLAVLLLSALTGCKNNNGATNPVGVYTLASVDDKNVPCSVRHGESAMTVKSGVFTINPDGTCRSQIIFSVPSHQDVSRDVKATYTQKGAELTMRWEGAGQTIGQINGDQFTMNNEGMVFSYRK